MKTNKTKLSAVEQFQADLMASMARYHSQVLSDNAKRAWKLRKERLATPKVAM